MIIVKKPKIRFKGFTETWEQRKLGELVGIYDGVHQTPDYQDSGIMFLSVENIATLKSEKYIAVEAFERDYKVYPEKGDILMTRIGDVGTTNVVETVEKVAFYVSLALLKPNRIDSYFLSNAMKTNVFQKGLRERTLVTAIPQKINKDEIGKIDIFITNNDEEQKKIGAYFSNLDHLITLHQRKCENLKKLKKFMLQKLFPQNGENVPEIRFSNFTDTWEQRKLGEICSRVQGNDGRMELPTLTISAANGWMKQEDRFTGNIAGKEQKNYTLLHKGELSYNHGNSKLAKYGTVFSLQTYEEALVPRVYHSFKVEIGSADFIEYFFATKMPDRELRKLISSGARMDGLLNIGYDDFMGIKMMFPSVLEQDKIAEYFRAFDHLITLHQSKCDKLKEVKKYMLQNMFI